MSKLLGRVAAGLALALIAFTSWLWWGPGPAKEDIVVTIPSGTSLQGTADYLHYAGAVDRRQVFYYLARLLGDKHPVQAGEFRIPAGASYADILNLLQNGRPIQRVVTIPEGWPSILVQERIAGLEFAKGEAPLPEEGSVLPNTYNYERGEERSAIVARMQKAMDQALDELWPKRTSKCPVNSKREAVILASIVEKETAKPEERRTIAGVYCNRLKIGMKLDADPTVIYPVTKGKPLGRRIRRSELNAVTGYNTYREPGLPEGPIANPGKASIAAVLDPAETEALYFVADGTGGHVFANTLAEHNANVKEWYAIRRKRGEMD